MNPRLWEAFAAKNQQRVDEDDARAKLARAEAAVARVRNNLTFAFRRAVSKAWYVWTCEQIEQAAAILGITLPGDEQ